MVSICFFIRFQKAKLSARFNILPSNPDASTPTASSRCPCPRPYDLWTPEVHPEMILTPVQQYGLPLGYLGMQELAPHPAA
jgi:hypothetical protein